MEEHKIYMQRCLELAELGAGNVAPNPMVGAVIVCDNNIIGEGYHQNIGGNHAEVNAIAAVKNKALLKKSVLYVNLEPCAHFGKTPPCASLVVDHKIPKVVVAMQDPNPLVAGKGLEILQKAGAEVILGILEKEALFLNRYFVCFQQKKRPFVILKWAETKDRYLDKERIKGEKGVYWITSEPTQVLVHQWRSEVPAILVGALTVKNDNPDLTVRRTAGKSPIRIVINRAGDIPPKSKVLNGEVLTLVYSEEVGVERDNVVWVKLDFNLDLVTQILADLYQRQINAVLVEGGKNTLERFLQSGHWDEARVLIGDAYFTNGLEAPKIKGIAPSFEDVIGVDALRVYLKESE